LINSANIIVFISGDICVRFMRTVGQIHQCRISNILKINLSLKQINLHYTEFKLKTSPQIAFAVMMRLVCA